MILYKGETIVSFVVNPDLGLNQSTGKKYIGYQIITKGVIFAVSLAFIVVGLIQILGLFSVDIYCLFQGELLNNAELFLEKENLPEFFHQFRSYIDAEGNLIEQAQWQLEEGIRILPKENYIFLHKEVYEYLPGLSSLNIGTAFVLFAAGLLGIAGGIFLMRGQKFGLAMFYGAQLLGIVYAVVYCVIYSSITWVPMVFVFLLQWLFGVLLMLYIASYFKKRRIFAGKPIR